MLEVGVLPAAGGWDDQTAIFQQAVSIALRERNGIMDQQRKEEVNRGRTRNS
jgi:hypothetical protein